MLDMDILRTATPSCACHSSVCLYIWLLLPGARIASESLSSSTCITRASEVFQSAFMWRSAAPQPRFSHQAHR